MTNDRVASYTNSVQVIACLVVCSAICSPSGIWEIMKLSYFSTTATDRIFISVYISISVSISIAVVVAFAISVVIDVYIGVLISIDITIVVNIVIYASIYISVTVSIIVSADMGFHLWLQGMDQLFQCPDMSAEARFG